MDWTPSMKQLQVSKNNYFLVHFIFISNRSPTMLLPNQIGIYESSCILASSSSMESRLHEKFRIEKTLDRSIPPPLNPVNFEDTMGITRTADALIGSSLNPSETAQALCQKECPFGVQIFQYCWIIFARIFSIKKIRKIR